MGIDLLEGKPLFGGPFTSRWVVLYLNRRQFDCSLEYTMFFWLGLCALSFIAYFLIPRGTALHELIHLPHYWWKIKTEKAVLPEGKKHFYGEHSRQYYLCFPSAVGNKQQNRIMIYFHGGAWRYGRPELFELVAERFTNMGFVTILPSCRRTPLFNYQDIRTDLDLLMLSLQEQFPGKSVKFIVGGMSSGGNLAAHLFYNRQAMERQGLNYAQFQGLLLLGAPLNLSAMPQNKHVTSFAGPTKSVLFQEANIEHHVQAKDRRPVLCIHGKQDGLVPIASAQQFFMSLEQKQSANVRRLHPDQATHLDVAAWVRTDSPFYSIILQWLETLDQ